MLGEGGVVPRGAEVAMSARETAISVIKHKKITHRFYISPLW